MILPPPLRLHLPAPSANIPHPSAIIIPLTHPPLLTPPRPQQTYFTHTRPRTDPTVCANILHLFHLHRRGHQLAPTLSYIHAVLLHRAYLDGTPYYASPDSFLYAVSRLLSVPHLPALHDALSPLLRERLEERAQVEGDAFSLAMRVLACRSVGVGCEGDVARLRGMQTADGGWEGEGIYKFRSTGVEIGNRGVVTALAVRALEGGK